VLRNVVVAMAPEASRCPDCGAQVAAAAKFCDQCGARLGVRDRAAAADRPNLEAVFAHLRSGEQRPATILMTDLCGYSSLGESADPEWLYDLINSVFDELGDCLVTYGAHIDKFVGDEIVALFGVPVAQERSVERAVRAALALRERMAELNREGRFGDLVLGLHTGINVGRVMVGPVGHSTRAQYTVIGDAVNVTKRLEDEAPEGEIYVTDAVRDAVAGLFKFGPVGKRSLAGRRQEVEVFRVLSAVSRSEEEPKTDTPLLGRETELAALSTAAEEARAGRQAVVYLVGPAGIGKSRLLREWSRRRETQQFRLLQCSCHTFGHHFPLLPIAEIVTQLIDTRVVGWPPRVEGDYLGLLEALDTPEEARHVARQLLEAFSGVPDTGNEEWRQALGSCLSAIIADAARRQPLCLILEDVQWLDEASAEVLAEALGADHEWPFLVLLTSREPLDQRFPSVLEPTLLPLTALPLETIEQLVRAWAAPDMLPESTVDAVCRRAEGHPYFARELVHALRHEVRQGDGGTELPHTLQELFLAQLDWLPLSLRRLVQAASVLGEPLATGLLGAALGTETPLTAHLLDEALRSGLLRPGQVPDQFVFGRRLLFEAAYGTIPTNRKRDLHARIATRITEQREVLGDLALHAAAHHAYLGFGDERAVELLLASARRYRLEYSNHQAIRDAVRATEIISSLTDPAALADQRLEALWLLAQSYEVLGDVDRAEAVLAEAELLLEDSTDRLMVGQIALSSATLSLMQGEITEAERRFARARGVWEELGDATRVAHALLGMGMCASAASDGARALDLYRQAADAPEVAIWVRAAALNNAGIALLGEGQYLAAEPFLVQGLAANESEGDRRGVAYSQASLGELHYRLAHLDQAAIWLDQALEGARRIEDPQCLATASLLRARVHLAQGNTTAAQEAFGEAEAYRGLDAEVDALGGLVEAELAVAAGTTPPMPDIPSPDCQTSAVCWNALAETVCLVAEALLRSGREMHAQAAIGQAAGCLQQAPDRHLRRHAAWLVAVAGGAPNAAQGCPPAGTGEWTIHDVRAADLLPAIGQGASPGEGASR